MRREVPKEVIDARPHSLWLVPLETAIELYVREGEFMAMRYTAKSTCELRLPMWDQEGVMCVAFLLRLGGWNAGTFERWINVAEPSGLRLVQLLAGQQTISTFLVTDRITRAFRQRNPLAGKAAGIVAAVRLRAMWTPEEFAAQCRRLDTLYPSAAAMWRGTRDRA